MKRKAILAGLLLSIGSFVFAAGPTDPELLKVSSLKTLSEKIDALNQQAAVSSRSGAAEVQNKLNAVYKEYAVELKKQKELTTDAKLKKAIDKELQVINEKLQTPATTNSK